MPTKALLSSHLNGFLQGQTRRELYPAIVAGFQSAITERVLKPGDVLPPERDLSATLGVSRNLVRRALQTLEGEGILVTRHGSGTVVSQDFRRSTNSILGFSEETRRRGMHPSSRVIRDVVRVPTIPEIRELGLAIDGDIRELVRVRLADDVPRVVEIALLPAWAIELSFDGKGQSLYEAMEARGTRPVRILQEISATAAETIVAEGLDVQPGSPVLKIIWKGLDASNIVVEFTTSYYPADQYIWLTELRR
ncbi:GntR family transcriptional regulator [Labrys miyagiensis]|uniref:GntR family transcriptional regulator n=1 Tax=Labrys miyagiensis TaxID=346912 RepID=A0ABQ6CC01_9HYPH|nr:GntR family transcriptional regulator [Labrys miyagiensis]GLS17198.1 GntR family transcriptional regulator [Labrys miyagiensis]